MDARLVDLYDAEAVRAVVERVRPGAAVSLVSAMPDEIDQRTLAQTYRENDRIRRVAAEHLARAVRGLGARLIASSSAYWYEPGPDPADETVPLWFSAPPPTSHATLAVAALEAACAATAGVALRCGIYLGPGTYHDRLGDVGRRLARGQYPVIGDGNGVSSFVHVDDVARAVVLALDLPPGAYNAVDDEPAPARTWIPAFAAAYGGPAPKGVPAIAARLITERGIVTWIERCRGASNIKLRAAGWTPEFASWRATLARSI